MNIAKLFYLLSFSFRSMLDLSVLKDAVECTSQRLKRTSGARDVNTFSTNLNLAYLSPTSDEAADP